MDREAKGKTMRRGKVIGVHSVRPAPPGPGSKRPDTINFNPAGPVLNLGRARTAHGLSPRPTAWHITQLILGGQK